MDWTANLSGLLGASIAALLGYWSLRNQKSARKNAEGWKALSPSGYLHFAFFGSLAFATLILWVRLFVGSSRPDAATQENIMVVLIVVFASAALWLWWNYYAVGISWRGRMIRIHRGRRVTEYRLDQIASKRFVVWRSEYVLEFSDGRKVVFSPYMRGGKELAEKLGLPLP